MDIEGLGYFLPSNYLPSQAQAFGLRAGIRFLPLLLVNLASIVGCVAVGVLTDRCEITRVLGGVSIAAAAAVLLLWGFASSYLLMCVFGVVYGLTAGGYSTSWGGMVRDILRQSDGADSGLLFGLLAAGRGVGAIVSGPVSELLIAAVGEPTGAVRSGYDSQYRLIVVFSGCTALLGGSSWLFRKTGCI